MNGLFYMVRRFKVASALNLLGLVAALTACYVLGTQIEFAQDYNKCIPECENVYRVESSGIFSEDEFTTAVPRPLAEKIAEQPQVEDILYGQLIGYRIGEVKKGTEYIPVNDTPVFSEGLRLARPKMLCGVDTLDAEFDALIPRSLAEKYFGETLVVGRQIDMAEGHLTVKGVYEDFPKNCSLGNAIYFHAGDEGVGKMGNWNYDCFVRLLPGTDQAALTQTIKKIYAEHWLQEILNHPEATPEQKKMIEEKTHKVEFSLRPITETYFSGAGDMDKGNRGMQLVLELAVVLLLIVSGINFANFTLAETPMRIKGINTRKVLGMTNGELRRGMILETVVTALVAFALSVGADYLLSLSPWLQSLILGTLALEQHIYLIIYIGTAALVIGLLVGLYPAWYATSFPPALVLKGSFGLSPKGQLYRKVLVCVQLLVAFGLSIYIGVLQLQSHFLFNSDYGFDKDEILYCSNVVYPSWFEHVRSDLENIPGVESIGYVCYMPGLNSGCMSWGRGEGDKYVQLAVMPCDWKFLPTVGIEILEGHEFTESDKDVFIVNEATRRKYAWVGIDKPLTDGECPVIGICKNFRVFTAREDNNNEPASFIIFGDKYESWQSPYCVVARVGKNMDKLAVKRELDEHLRKLLTYREEGEVIPEFQFMDECLQQTYEDEFRFIHQVEIFSLICLIITLVGVLCLTMFETEYRRKEIGIRKVLGSSTRDIVLMFCRRYLWLIAAAFVFAAPLAYIMSEQWLQNFAERTPVHWWLLPLVLLAVSAIVLATVAVQTWRTAHENPVNSIKTE